MKNITIKPGSKVDISRLDPASTSAASDEDAARNESVKFQEKLATYQSLLFAERKHSVLIVLQGMDTSGKDGTVRHVMGGFNPAGVKVVSFKKPTEDELDHDYLWRVHAQTPARGEVVVFNRSHYEDVLVVRVHDLVPKKVWKKRYAQINEFERMLTESGTTILKFFLHISKDEQRERLQERIDDPTKRWKFQHGDLDERKLWPDYMKAYEDVLEKTSTEWAPWHVVPSDRKWYRNWVVGKVLVDALKSLDMQYPEVDLSAVTIDE